MGPATDRHEDPPDLLRAALLDDGDVAWRLSNDLIDGRGEDGRTTPLAAAGRLATPAEDDEVRLLLRGGLDDALGGVPADANDGVDRGAVRGVVQDALEESPRMPRAGRALGQRHALGDLHDAERGEFAGPLVEHRGPEPDEFLGGHRVGHRDQDADRQRLLQRRRQGRLGRPLEWPLRRRLGAHPAASFQRETRYGLSSSNSRAWRSTRSSAWAVVTLRFSTMKLPTRPK